MLDGPFHVHSKIFCYFLDAPYEMLILFFGAHLGCVIITAVKVIPLTSGTLLMKCSPD
jgi:hypothetical protein